MSPTGSGVRSTLAWLAVGGFWAVPTGCERVQDLDVSTSSAEFVKTQEITLATPENQKLRDVSRLAFDPQRTDRIAVVDAVGHRVVLVDPERAEVVASTDPGSLTSPKDVLYLGDRILVSDQEPRLLVADPVSLKVSEVLELEQALFALRVHRTSGGFITEGTDTHNPQATLYEYGADGELLRAFHPLSAESNAPFWSEFTWERLAVSSVGLVVASSMRYPLTLYPPDGSTIEFGAPPDGYRPPRRPEPFEFSGGPDARTRYEAFARSFTSISSIWATNRHIVVEHRDLDLDESAYRLDRYRVDIYDIETLGRVAENQVLGGAIVGLKDDEVVVLSGRPPRAAWTVSLFEVMSTGNGQQ